MTYAAEPVSVITLEDTLVHSGKLAEELSTLVRAAARIDDTLSGNHMVDGDQPADPKPAGMLSALHENLCDVSYKTGVLSTILGRIEDRLHQPKVANAAQPVPFPPPVPADFARYGGPCQPAYKR